MSARPGHGGSPARAPRTPGSPRFRAGGKGGRTERGLAPSPLAAPAPQAKPERAAGARRDAHLPCSPGRGKGCAGPQPEPGLQRPALREVPGAAAGSAGRDAVSSSPAFSRLLGPPARLPARRRLRARARGRARGRWVGRRPRAAVKASGILLGRHPRHRACPQPLASRRGRSSPECPSHRLSKINAFTASYPRHRSV